MESTCPVQIHVKLFIQNLAFLFHLAFPGDSLEYIAYLVYSITILFQLYLHNSKDSFLSNHNKVKVYVPFLQVFCF